MDYRTYSVRCPENGCDDVLIFLKPTGDMTITGTCVEPHFRGKCRECDTDFLLSFRNKTDDYYVFRILEPDYYKDQGILDVINENVSVAGTSDQSLSLS